MTIFLVFVTPDTGGIVPAWDTEARSGGFVPDSLHGSERIFAPSALLLGSRYVLSIKQRIILPTCIVALRATLRSSVYQWHNVLSMTAVNLHG